jgi:hypothetical protein
MLQLFFKTSRITPEDWAIAYARIESIVTHFPLKLLRIEGYIRRSPHLDKDHFELRENIGTPDESLAFYGDWVSFTGGCTIRFYKNWEKYVQKRLSGEEIEVNKSLTWYPHEPFRNNGIYPKANGLATSCLENDSAFYDYAIWAIGILLENLLPDKVFLLGTKQSLETIDSIRAWLEVHFNETFDLPLIFHKKRLLHSLKNQYGNKSQLVNRLACLAPKQYKVNIEFALQNIGYAPTLDCYAQILSNSRFGTFGFSDVLDAWIAATQDLESTLELIAVSKQYAIQNEQPQAAAEYDLNKMLQTFLKQYILWTPAQREILAPFYTNQQALETGNESLMGMIYRMMGNRVNICPMFATEQSLFEAFMYHDPKKGAVFKQIIETWVAQNAPIFEELRGKIGSISNENPETVEEQIDEKDYMDSQDIDIQSFVNQYPKHEQPLIHLALSHNPIYAAVEEGINKLRQQLQEWTTAPEHQPHVQALKSNPKTENIRFMHTRIKEIEISVHPLFEDWLRKETHKKVIFYLTLLLSMKFYERSEAYIRYRLLWDKTYWDFWRKAKIF